MTRLIDADALKTALKSNCKPELCHDYNTAWCESCCRTNEFEDLIDNAPTVAEIFKSGSAVMVRPIEEKKQGAWIPVSERLPEDMQRVLIWFEYFRYGDFNCMYQTYGFGYVLDGKWSPFINGETGWQDYRVIAWQPLPEPYKKEGAE